MIELLRLRLLSFSVNFSRVSLRNAMHLVSKCESLLISKLSRSLDGDSEQLVLPAPVVLSWPALSSFPFCGRVTLPRGKRDDGVESGKTGLVGAPVGADVIFVYYFPIMFSAIFTNKSRKSIKVKRLTARSRIGTMDCRRV